MGGMRYLLLFCCASLVFGQGTEPKPKAEDYEVHAQAQKLAIGVEFNVHSYSGANRCSSPRIIWWWK